MRNRRFVSAAIAAMALVIPAAALANVTGTPTLAANSAISLDTGAVTQSSGGDLLWSGSSFTPQGNATATNLGPAGQAAFAVLSQASLPLLPNYSKAPIPISASLVNDVFAVKTNAGNYAAVLVTAVNGTSVTIQFNTFGSAVAAPSGPTISQVLNNYGLIPAGFSNSGIAPGSLFIIKGSGLADPNAQALPLQSSTGAGLPTTLNGASVKVTVNGTSTVPAFYYAIAAQLALVLPSSTPTGQAQLTVTYNGQTSAPYTFQVVTSAMGFDAYYGTGSGLGVAQNPSTGALYGYSTSIPPGTTIQLYGSGLGADPARDTQYVTPPFAINNLAHIYVGGVDAPIYYQGASGFPGLNQIDVTIPANAPTGCNVPLVGVTAAGVPTNFITLPIGTGNCADPLLGTSGSQLQVLTGQSAVKTGFVAVSHTAEASGPIDVALAEFQSVSGTVSGGGTSIGGCTVNQSLGTPGLTSSATGLNAGSLTITGAGLSATLQANAQLPGLYLASLPSGSIPASGGAAFTITGTGGSNVGSFTTTVNFPTTILNWTNQSAAATVSRASGLTVNWTGGSSNTYVVISGSASSSGVSGGFTCLAPTAAGTFTVPGYVTSAMPAGSGNVTVSNYTSYQPFQATGLDSAFSAGFVSFSVNSAFN